MSGTVYQIKKECGQCFFINSKDQDICSQCGELMVREATVDEAKALILKLQDMIKRKSK